MQKAHSRGGRVHTRVQDHSVCTLSAPLTRDPISPLRTKESTNAPQSKKLCSEASAHVCIVCTFVLVLSRRRKWNKI